MSSVLATQYRFATEQGIPDHLLRELMGIPGVSAQTPYGVQDPIPYVMGYTLYASVDAIPLVAQRLTTAGIRHHVAPTAGVNLHPYPVLERISGLKPATLAQLYPHQRVGLEFFCWRGGGYAHWEMGGGKTLEGIAFSLLDPDPSPRILIVTLANLTYQWESAIHWLTEPGVLRPFVLDGEYSSEVIPAPVPPPVWTWLVDPTTGWRSVYPRKPYPGDEALTTTQRRALVRGGVMEETLPARRPLMAVRSKVSGVIHVDFDGTEPLLLPSSVYDKARAKARVISSAKDLESHLIVSSVGTAPLDRLALEWEIPLDKILLTRARILARAAQAQRGSEVDLPPDANVVILGYPVLQARRAMLTRWNPTTVIVDEAQRAKDPDMWVSDGDRLQLSPTSWSGGVLGVSQRSRRILMLSGTPAPDAVRDWYAQLHILTGGMGRKRDFSNRYCGGHDERINNTFNRYNDAGSSNPEELARRLDFWCHRVSLDIIRETIPKTTRTLIKIPPERLAQVKIRPEEWRTARSGGAIGLLELQIQIAAASKRPFTAERILAHVSTKRNAKILVLGGRQDDADLLGADLRGKFPGDVWVAHGESHPDARERHELALKYRAHNGPVVLVGTMDAWGTGVDGLQDTDWLLLPYLPWSPGKLDQTEGRVDRPGNLSDLPLVPIHPDDPIVLGSDLPPGHRGMGPRQLRATTIEYLWAERTIDDKIGGTFLDKVLEIGVTYGNLRQRLDDLHRTLTGGTTDAERLLKLAEALVADFPDDFEDDD